MFHLIFFIFIFLLSLAVSVIFSLPVLFLLRALKFDRAANRWGYWSMKVWGRFLIFTAGGRVRVYGLENLPKSDHLCVVANHQSYGDIPLLLGYLNKPLGFVAKQELRKLPVLNVWMIMMHSVFLDRGNIRKSIPLIRRAARYIHEQHSIVIFPEGTRSKDGTIKRFKQGSFKLATLSGGIILPVTIDGTWRFTSIKRRITGGPIRVTVHKSIDSSQLSPEKKATLAEDIQKTIGSGLRDDPS